MFPDFDTYDESLRVTEAQRVAHGVAMEFSDGTSGEFHAFVLWENATSAIHPVTREQTRMLRDAPDHLFVKSCQVTNDGKLVVEFGPTNESNTFEPGWLHAWS